MAYTYSYVVQLVGQKKSIALHPKHNVEIIVLCHVMCIVIWGAAEVGSRLFGRKHYMAKNLPGMASAKLMAVKIANMFQIVISIVFICSDDSHLQMKRLSGPIWVQGDTGTRVVMGLKSATFSRLRLEKLQEDVEKYSDGFDKWFDSKLPMIYKQGYILKTCHIFKTLSVSFQSLSTNIHLLLIQGLSEVIYFCHKEVVKP